MFPLLCPLFVRHLLMPAQIVRDLVHKRQHEALCDGERVRSIPTATTSIDVAIPVAKTSVPFF